MNPTQQKIKENINKAEIDNQNLEKRKKSIKNEIDETISNLDQKRMAKSDILKTYNEKRRR